MTPCTTDIRLVGGKVESEGAVEVLVDGDWGLICGNDWGKEEGLVSCRQLGYCSPVSTQRGWDPPVNEKNIMHWHSLNCSGREDRLRDCPKSRGSFPCSAYNFEAGVTCKSKNFLTILFIFTQFPGGITTSNITTCQY